ncbi:ATP-binding protein [Colwellia sp. UCD-KL20]|uniref:ATP-binding protein n=1 Tax=Colwellia sp. UCD-KL20 TaxID=1917165 RepID=UPI00257098C7|nr:ATP-binding protein [Colwellia sp. UCD-KL20]
MNIFNKFHATKHWLTQSLKARLMLSAMFMIVVTLPVIGITLSNAFNDQLQSALENELRAYSYSIFSVAEVEDNQLVMPEMLLENQFNVIQSGLYAQITSIDLDAFKDKKTQPTRVSKNLWQSDSLLGVHLSNDLPSPKIGNFVFTEMLIENQPHMAYSISVSFGELEQAFPVTLHIFKNQAEFLAITNGFKQQLWTWLILLIVIFIIAQFIWLKWTLKPLNTLTVELEQVEQGKQNALEKNYPLELEQVTSQLNTLLSTEQNQRKRYRNALSDLAHSLKTPLAVIQSQQALPQETKEQISNISNMVEHQLKRAQSAGESAWHLGVSVEQTTSKLVNTLNKIYQDKFLTISVNIQKKALFKGDEADLMEILGNLLDNACKAAKSRIDFDVSFNTHCLRFTIADDGQGIEESQRKAILERGTRADTYDKGHGIGLAIVRDLVSSYKGELTIQNSSALGGALFVLTFHK